MLAGLYSPAGGDEERFMRRLHSGAVPCEEALQRAFPIRAVHPGRRHSAEYRTRRAAAILNVRGINRGCLVGQHCLGSHAWFDGVGAEHDEAH